MNRRTTLLALMLVAALAWAISLGATFGNNVPRADPVVGCTAGRGNDPLPSRQKLAQTIAQPATPDNNIEPIPGDNCTRSSSCLKLGCWKVFGGSQYAYSNGIPSCVKDPDPKCYDVSCYVETYYTANCKGEREGSWVTKRGCRR